MAELSPVEAIPKFYPSSGNEDFDTIDRMGYTVVTREKSDKEQSADAGYQVYSMEDWPRSLKKRIGLMNDARRRYEFPPKDEKDFDIFLDTFKIMPSQGEIEKYMTLLKARGFIAKNIVTA